MSFSSRVKNEICRNQKQSRDEAIAELSALMKASGSLSIIGNGKLNFNIVTENAAISRCVFKLLKNFFNIHTKIIVKKSNSLKKNNIYVSIITEEMGVREFLKETGILSDDGGILEITYHISENIIKDEKCKKAYIKGAFLGGGSVSNPEKTYHLEFITHNFEYGQELSNLINGFGLTSKVIQRKSSFIVYIKEGEQIIDVLSIIGAHSSLLYLENVRIIKEMRNNVNRLVNCETANLSKTVNASVRQVESINVIRNQIGLQRLPKNLREIAELRLEHPDESLKELGEMLNPPIGKSGVNHRLRRIERIAKELVKN